MNNKLYKKLLWGIGVVIVAVILTLFIVSRTYIRNLVYHERLNQMEEVTHQMFRSLEDVIDTHWDEVNVQCNYLYCTTIKTDTDLYRYLKKLSELEKSNCCEPDETADCFARICEIIFTPDFITDEKTGQILSWMGYNIGRWIYLLDALDDLKDDIKHNSYNPFKDRYKDEKLAENTESTLTYNLANIAAAYDLLDVKRNDKIIRNILYSGMGGVQNEILKLREENNESLRGSRCKSE